ncbi:MAG TPA: wax ester/triacylglycerol synthase domain-containing protein [Acidimicrobiales bacterium]|nr:wax ester/triacylglycerol synthase domain-containing protein [Acidimicrobiales bacterium]
MTEPMRFEQRMSDSDALMWGIEADPLLRSTIIAIAVLDQAPDHEQLMAKVHRGTLDIARLRQRAVSPPWRVAPPRWVVDPNFDLRYHVRFTNAVGDGSLRSLLDFAAPIAMQSFDRARPLWEFTVVEGLANGQAALIQKVHHAVTDGVGGMKMAMMLLDLERDPAPSSDEPPPAPEPETYSPIELLRDGLAHERRRQLGIAQRSVGDARAAAARPLDTMRSAAMGAASLARMLRPVFAPMSPIMTGRSLSARFDVVSAPLGEMKAAAKKADGRLNDAFVAAIAGGLARYHERHGVPVEALRMSMPINIRAADSEVMGGNQFVPVRFAVPMNIADPLERMRQVRELVATQRAEPALAFTEAVAGILNRLPTGMTTQLFGGMLKGMDFVTSNVPGAPIPVFLAGAQVTANYALGPLSGAAINATLLSHLDDVFVGINSDPAAVPDPEVLTECLEEGFAEVRKVA